MKRQHDGETGAPRLALPLDRALVLAHQILRQRQPQPGSPFAPRDQWKKYLVAQLVWYTRPVIDDLDRYSERVKPACESDLARDARAQHDVSVALHGLGRIAHDVEQRLD